MKSQEVSNVFHNQRSPKEFIDDGFIFGDKQELGATELNLVISNRNMDQPRLSLKSFEKEIYFYSIFIQLVLTI